MLHASGVAVEGHAVLFAGESGAGKSTLLAEMLRRGHPMLVDDVCALYLDDDSLPVVLPSYPRTRLWADTAERFAIDTSELPRTVSSWDKFERQIGDQFCDHATPLAHLFLLAGTHDEDEFSIDLLSPTEAFATLVQHTYRDVLLDGFAMRAKHFELASGVAKAVPFHRVLRPAQSFRLDELADLVLNTVGGIA